MTNSRTKAQVLTIGTEITSGEIVNSNAAWISERLEEFGIRVHRHLTVQDDPQEIIRALSSHQNCEVTIVAGGLGPTTDDCTRAVMAEYAHVELDFDEKIWQELRQLHESRDLPIRESHRHQCYIPRGATPLKNPVGSAVGFYQLVDGRHYFVLPGPPREVEGMWNHDVAHRLESLRPEGQFKWERWTCIGAPESEIADLVEAILVSESAQGKIEVGYRASIPYVKVKLFLDLGLESHRRVREKVGYALGRFLIGVGDIDLAYELLKVWPGNELSLEDSVSGSLLAMRLLQAREQLLRENQRVPQIAIAVGSGEAAAGELKDGTMRLSASADQFCVEMRRGQYHLSESRNLPFKISLRSERGRKTAAEWALFLIRQRF